MPQGVYVRLNRALSDSELCGNRFIRRTLNQKTKHAALAVRQRLRAGSAFEFSPRAGGHIPFTAGNAPDRAQHFVATSVFEHVPFRARRETAVYVVIAVERREDQDSRARVAPDDRLRRVDAVHVRHVQIENRNVGPMSTEEVDSLVSIAALTDDPQVAFIGKNESEPFAHDRMVIDEDDTDRI